MQRHPLDQLHDQRRALIEKVRQLETHLHELRATNIPRIKEQSLEADRLAPIFRSLYSQSDTARKAHDFETADQLSNEGRAAETQCRGLNDQVNAMRQELRDAEQAVNDAMKELANMKSRISSYEYLMRIPIDGFEQAYGVSAEIVRDELSTLPMRILRHIKRVAYVHEKRPDYELGRTASKEHNPDQTTIFLFQYPFDLDLAGLDLAGLEKEYRNTIIHEAAHVLFDWLMSTDQRLKWGELHKATRLKGDKFINDEAEKGKRDDFVECFETYRHNPDALLEYDEKTYRHDPSALLEHDEGRYTFIDKIYKEVSGE